MITKNDCLSILVKLEASGLNVDAYMKQLIIAKEIPTEVLQFIVNNKGIEVTSFYEMLRKNHNKKKSPLYLNIVREQKEDEEIILTLSCLLTQIILYSKKLTTSKLDFLKEARAEEITRALNIYFKEDDIKTATTVLQLVRADLLVLEGIKGRREIANKD